MSQVKAGRPKSQSKKRAILETASDLFLYKGFDKTSMEEVARQSGVAKQTIYSHYRNKDILFSAVIEAKCEEYKLYIDLAAARGKNLKENLLDLAREYVALFHDADVIAMHSTVISEAKNTPHVAELFYAAGPQTSIDSLTQLFSENSDYSLSIEDSHSLAIDFFSFIKSEIHTRSLMGLPYALNENQIEPFVQSVVNRTLCLCQHYYQ